MHAAPIPSEVETRCNAVFDALMWALSRPGLRRALPDTGAAQIVDALIDRECAVWAADPAITARAGQVGAALVALAQADHLFAGALVDADALRGLRCGSDLYPDDGATLVVDAQFDTGEALRVTGPGVNGAETLRVGGLPDGFWAVRAEAMRYPMGFELFLLSGDQVIGIPRSTKVEVL